MEEIDKNDYNLNISRYISTAEAEPEIDLATVHAQLTDVEKRIVEATEAHNRYLKELGCHRCDCSLWRCHKVESTAKCTPYTKGHSLFVLNVMLIRRLDFDLTNGGLSHLDARQQVVVPPHLLPFHRDMPQIEGNEPSQGFAG